MFYVVLVPSPPQPTTIYDVFYVISCFQSRHSHAQTFPGIRVLGGFRDHSRTTPTLRLSPANVFYVIPALWVRFCRLCTSFTRSGPPFVRFLRHSRALGFHLCAIYVIPAPWGPFCVLCTSFPHPGPPFACLGCRYNWLVVLGLPV